MKIKKGFSFFEVLIVLVVVGILFVAFRSVFYVKNKDIFYGQACIESIYGQVNNFLFAGMSSKSINSWWTQIFPNTYSIHFDPDNQKIDLIYNDDAIYNSMTISWQSNILYCNNNSITIYMSGDNYHIIITKGLQAQQHNKPIYLSGVDFLGRNIFWLCNIEGDDCKEIAAFTTDTRTINIQKQMCLSFTGAGECYERDN